MGGDSSTHLLPLVTRGPLIASHEREVLIQRMMIEKNVSLKKYSNYVIGGVARYFCHAGGLADLVEAVSFAEKKNLPVFVLGGGTNVLFDDSAFKGLVVKPDIRFVSSVAALPETVAVTVGAGFSMDELLSFCATNGYSGLEWAGGLPGTVGGAIRGNAGAFGGEMKDSVTEVMSFSPVSKGIVKRDAKACVFGYRSSVFKEKGNREIVLAATFSLVRAGASAVRYAMYEKIAWRASRQPLEYANVGSIFKNVAWEKVPVELQTREDIKRHMKTDPMPVIPAAFLIDQAGLKGVSCGGAMVSQKHPNFIVNALGATSGHVRQLIALVKHDVYTKFGIMLEEEIELL